MRVLEGFCVREVMDEVIAIPTGEAAKRFSGIISLNPVSRFLFERLSEDQTVASLTAALTAEYDVDARTAEADVGEFLAELREHGLLIGDGPVV